MSKSIIFLVLILVVAIGLAGCGGARYSVNTGNATAGNVAVGNVTPGTTTTTSRLQVSGDARLGAALIIGLMLADGLRYFRVAPDGSRTPVADAAGNALPPRVSVQDCSRPVDTRSGNLVCR